MFTITVVGNIMMAPEHLFSILDVQLAKTKSGWTLVQFRIVSSIAQFIWTHNSEYNSCPIYKSLMKVESLIV